MRNVDFNIEDLDSSAGWLRNIKALNYEYGLETGRVSMTGGGAEELPEGESEGKGYRWSETEETVEVSEFILRLTIRVVSVVDRDALSIAFALLLQWR
jgi:hypothetical protein